MTRVEWTFASPLPVSYRCVSASLRARFTLESHSQLTTILGLPPMPTPTSLPLRHADLRRP